MMLRQMMALFACAPVAFAAVADAGQGLFTPEKVSADIALGTLSGQTKAHVYEPDFGGKEIYQATWKYNNAAIVKSSLDWDVMPWISLGASGWTTIASRGGDKHISYFEDPFDNQPEGEFYSPYMRLNYANQFDLNIKAWFLNEPGYRLGVTAGYQESRYSFKTNGGFGFYNDGGTRVSYTVPYDVVGGYNQRFKMPYVGLVGSYRYERYELGGSLKYSRWGRSYDNEDESDSNISFSRKIRNQNYFSLGANAGYYVTPNAMVYLEGVWSRTTNNTGKGVIYDHFNGTAQDNPHSTGIENYSLTTTIGLKYTF
ncbi:omptin family outer membrane protease [Erwinia amylovora]|uniref:omptin family outer membrane protease n=1 Tax=Erwinia amylovora TaxID=552 RepID=UPI000C08C2BA|nr:omptin family outer membrane protease [Erwinia amylovora]